MQTNSHNNTFTAHSHIWTRYDMPSGWMLSWFRSVFIPTYVHIKSGNTGKHTFLVAHLSILWNFKQFPGMFCRKFPQIHKHMIWSYFKHWRNGSIEKNNSNKTMDDSYIKHTCGLPTRQHKLTIVYARFIGKNVVSSFT